MVLYVLIPESSQVHRCNGRIYDRNENPTKVRTLDNNKMPKVISTAYEKLIYEAILNLKTDRERMEFIEQINRSMGLGEFDVEENRR